LIYLLDLFGTFAFAVSGGFRAVKHELDLLGLSVLALATGIGGGIIRDVLLGINPPGSLKDERYLLVCLAGAFVVYVAAPRIAVRWNRVLVADALGLSVFAAIGAAKAESHGAGMLTTVMMAMLTACGGGVIRDLLVIELPAILKIDFYATAAMLGGFVYSISGHLGWSEPVRLTVTILLTLILRLLAMRMGISLPKVSSLPASPSQLTKMRKERKAP